MTTDTLNFDVPIADPSAEELPGVIQQAEK
jgi:hypothetical protein